MKSTFSILFYIDRSKPSGEGLCLVRCRISCNGRTASFSTRQQTSPDDWLAKKGRVGPTSAVAQGVNHALSDIEQRLNALYECTLREERYITAEYLKEQYLRQDKPRQTFADIYSALCEEKAAHKSKATARGFRDSYKSFVRFLDMRELRRCLPHEVDKALIEAYRLYMLRDLGYKMSSVAVYLRRLHQVFRWAMLEAGLREDPFDLIDIETPAYERNALSAEDLQRLLAYRPHRSVDNHVRLIFLLGCFTGLAFSDLKKLRMEDVYTLDDGRRYLSICRTKTQNACIVPLLPIAEEILAFAAQGRTEGLYFREFPVNSHFNRKIRELLVKAGCSPHTEASSHTARHTFATTICLENGLPIETVSRMLGHRFISTTELYAKVSKQKIAQEMRPLMGSEQTQKLRRALRVCPPRKRALDQK
ncbi:recombinase [Tannerella sp. oral taxon 808]|nr:recombinase [Tannerella sp. oral taxon 808]